MADEIISGKLAEDRDGNPIQVLAPETTIADDVDGVSDNNVLPSGASEGEIIRVSVNQDTYINFGDVSVTAAATDILMPAGTEYFQVPEDAGYIAYLQVSTAGRISVTHMK